MVSIAPALSLLCPTCIHVRSLPPLPLPLLPLLPLTPLPLPLPLPLLYLYFRFRVGDYPLYMYNYVPSHHPSLALP